jgi:transposase-like protein
VTGSNDPKRYSPEFKDEAAKMVVDLSRPIAQVAHELGISRTTLGFWVKAYRQHSADNLPIDMPDRARNRPDEAAYIIGLVARMGREACPVLDTLLADWDGRLTTLSAPKRYLAAQHIERCEACQKSSHRAMRAAVPSGLDLRAGQTPDAAAYRQDAIQRADSRPPDEPGGMARLLWWSRIRDNPGAATGVIALWGMATLIAVLILVTGGRAVSDLAVHIGDGPVATASAPASPSGSVASARAPASSSPSPSGPHSADVPAPAAGLAGTPTAPGTPAVPLPTAAPSRSPKPSRSASPSPSASSSPAQTPTPVRSLAPQPMPTPSPSPSLSPSSSTPAPSLTTSPPPHRHHSRSPYPHPHRHHSRSPYPHAHPSPSSS